MSYLPFILLIPFFCGVASLLLVARRSLVRGLSVTGAIAQLGLTIQIMREVSSQGMLVLQVGGWEAPFGITLMVDRLSALMLLVTAVISVAVFVYSSANIGGALVRKYFHALCHFLLMGVNGAFVAADLFNLYVWFEVMLLSSFVLISFEGRRSQLEGGVKYLIINLLSSILFLSSIGLLYGKLGTLNMADIARLLSESPDSDVVHSSAVLLLSAFAIKSALFPFFFWLPASYHTPRIAIAALFAGLLTKVGIYSILRAMTLMFHSGFEDMQWMLLVVAGMTMLTGVLGAAAQYDIRRILSFHIISQIGYIMMGVAVGTHLAIAGAIFYIFHHIIVKANLFLIAGLIGRRYGTTELKRLGGLLKSAPGLALLFFIPAFSLGGIPPLSGFWAKFGVIKASLDSGHGLLVATALFVGALTLFSMTKIWAEAFWKPAPAGLRATKSWTKRELWPCICLAVMTVGIGLWSEPLFAWSLAAAEQILTPELYLEHVLGGS